jgi:putative tryptophan/tyrosine transport system substrate-binding protein
MIASRSSSSRRQFLQGSLAIAGLGLLPGCGLSPTSRPAPPRTVKPGILGNFPSPQWDAFRAGVRELGYVEGQSIAFEERWSDGIQDRFPALAAELVALHVDVIVASGNFAARAAQQATTTIPIVSPYLSYPVADGIVASLAHPGGNITGLSILGIELDPKRLTLLKEAVPRIQRVALLGDAPFQIRNPEMLEAARRLGGQVNGLLAQDPDGVDIALQATTGGQVDALQTSVSALFLWHRGKVLSAAATSQLPAMYALEEYVRDGGLMFYGPNQPDLFRRAATYVDKILKGTKPAGLPVEQPTTFDLIINLKTAQTLGLTIPQSILQQATEVIQ